MDAWFTRTPKRPAAWRGFACLAVVAIVSTSEKGSAGSNASMLTYVALLGLVGYAFGFRLGPIMFWRAYAIIYAVFVTGKLAMTMLPKLIGSMSMSAQGVGLAVAATIILASFGVLFLALFRHAEMTGPEATAEPTLAEVFS